MALESSSSKDYTKICVCWTDVIEPFNLSSRGKDEKRASIRKEITLHQPVRTIAFGTRFKSWQWNRAKISSSTMQTQFCEFGAVWNSVLLSQLTLILMSGTSFAELGWEEVTK
jgi:hypothetical protein